MNTQISLDKVINVGAKLNDKESAFRKKLLDKIISSQELVYYDNGISEDDQKNTYALKLDDAFKVAEKTFSIRQEKPHS